jgi:hypothetical protein
MLAADPFYSLIFGFFFQGIWLHTGLYPGWDQRSDWCYRLWYCKALRLWNWVWTTQESARQKGSSYWSEFLHNVGVVCMCICVCVIVWIIEFENYVRLRISEASASALHSNQRPLDLQGCIYTTELPRQCECVCLLFGTDVSPSTI